MAAATTVVVAAIVVVILAAIPVFAVTITIAVAVTVADAIAVTAAIAVAVAGVRSVGSFSEGIPTSKKRDRKKQLLKIKFYCMSLYVCQWKSVLNGHF
jgi:hypothetical protein